MLDDCPNKVRLFFLEVLANHFNIILLTDHWNFGLSQYNTYFNLALQYKHLLWLLKNL